MKISALLPLACPGMTAMGPDALPGNLRRRILVCDEVHPRLGSPCWMWTGRTNRNGYGRAWHGGAEPVAHRAVYEEMVGAIPAGLILDHLCRWRRCCNPGHVEPVTPRENVLRGEAILFAPATASTITEGAQAHA